MCSKAMPCSLPLPYIVQPSPVFPRAFRALYFLNNLFGLVEAAVVCSVVVCRLSCPKVCGILVPRSGIEPTFPALEGWFAATGLTGKSPPFPSPLGPLSPAHWLSPQDAHQAGRLLPQPDVPRDSESSGATRLSSLPPVGGSYSRSVSSNSFLAWALRTSSPMLVSTLFSLTGLGGNLLLTRLGKLAHSPDAFMSG